MYIIINIYILLYYTFILINNSYFINFKIETRFCIFIIKKNCNFCKLFYSINRKRFIVIAPLYLVNQPNRLTEENYDFPEDIQEYIQLH